MTDPRPVDKQDSGENKHEELLRDIREDFAYFRDFWRENHDEAKKDLRFVAGDPWEPDERRAREDNSRPVLCPDELDQYLNATINNLRQNKRAIKVNPKGSGANDKDAANRSAIIRGIEYKSNAQSAYTNAFEGAINCGMGYFRITTKIINKDNEVEPRIKIIENPLSVLLDPNAKEADFSDQKRCFVMDVMRQRDFKKSYPKATKTSFAADDIEVAPDWFAAENILIAEYWRIDGYDPDTGEGGEVKQYITNGIEILDEREWPGSWIPIIPTVGKKVYVPSGGEMKRMYYSMIRKARGPQMMLAYIASQEAEEYGMAPRAPLIGYVGQFETDAEAFATLNKVPRSYVQIDPMVDQASGSILPLPTRMPFTPNAQAYEIGKESWRRSLQASMGISALPTAAQRQNEKSGVALDKIQSQQAVGSFHFTDNFDRALEYGGRQLDELITKVMDTPRQVGTRQPDESHQMLHVVPKGQQMPAPEDGKQLGPDDVFDPSKGDFDVTISTGMSYQSQREEASAFVDLLIQNLKNLPVPPPVQAKLLSLAISLKDIGPVGDEIAKMLDPDGDGEPMPPQAQQAISQLQEHLKAVNAAAQQYEGQIQQLTAEKQAKVVEQQGKLAQIAAQSQADMALEDKKLLAQITIAEINTKAQNEADREADRRALELQLHDQAHDVGMNAVQHGQAQQMAQQQAAQQLQLQAQQGDQQSQQSAQDAEQAQAAQEAQPQDAGE